MNKLSLIIILLLATQSLTSEAFACNKAASFHNALHLPITIPVSATLSLVGYAFDFLSLHAGIWPMAYIFSTEKERKKMRPIGYQVWEGTENWRCPL